MEDNNLEQAMKSWLSDEVKKYCNNNGMIELYWDYDDRSALKDSIKKYMDGYESGNLTEYIADQMREENWWFNWCDEYEDDFYAGIHNDIETIKDEALKSYVADKIGDMDYTDLHDLLEEVGYNGIDDGIEEELRNLKLNVNLTLATDDEANYDMSSIITCFGTDYLQVEFDSLDAQHLDNALTYLVHQQGHSLKELYDALLGNKEAGTFIKSVVNEIENDPAEATCGLTVLVSVGTDEYGALLSKEGNIEVSADTELGLYNSWIGGGSVFEISLEKPFVFPASMVLHADFDDVTGSGNYSVGDTYGTMGEDRKGTITRGGETSVQSEDLDAVADYVRTTYGDGEEVEESKKITESEEPEEDKKLDFKERVRLAYENCSCSCGMPTIKNIVDYLDMNFEYDNKLHNKIGDILYELGYDWKLEEMKENKKVTEGLRQDTIDAIDLAINEIDNGNNDDPDWFNERYDTYDKLVQGVLDLIGANIKYGSGVEKEPTSAVNFSGKEAIINEIKRQLAEWGYEESDFGKKTEDIAFMGDLRDSIDTENLIEPEDKFEIVFDSDVGDLEDIKTADEEELFAGGELASLYVKDKDNDIIVVLEYNNGFFINTYHWDESELYPDLIESIEIALTPETTEQELKNIMIDKYKKAIE